MTGVQHLLYLQVFEKKKMPYNLNAIFVLFCILFLPLRISISQQLFWSPGGSFTFKNYMLFHLHEVLSRKSETVFRMVVVRVEGIDGFGWTEFQFYKMKGL